MNEIKLFQDQKVRTLWNEDEKQWYFSVVDVCNVLSESASIDPGAYWRKLKQRLKVEGSELVTNCHGLKMPAADGKMRETDALTTDGILRLVQSIPSKRAEPFKLWLAKVGRERLEEIANPELAVERMRVTYLKKGYSEEWIQTRLQSIEIRKKLAQTWQDRGLTDSRDYAILTAEISEGTFGMTPKQYKDFKGLANPLDNVRDHMTDVELIFTMLGEAAAKNNSIRFDAQDFEENEIAAKKAGRSAGEARKAFEKDSGEKVSVPTNYLEVSEAEQRQRIEKKSK